MRTSTFCPQADGSSRAPAKDASPSDPELLGGGSCGPRATLGLPASKITETTDPQVAEHLLRDVYGSRLRIDAHGQGGKIRLDLARLTPAARLDQLSFALTFDIQADPADALVIAHVGSGRVTGRAGGGEQMLGPGDVGLCVQPGQPYTARWADLSVDTAVLSPALLSQVADAAPGRVQQPVQFTGYTPVSPQAARSWTATYAYVRGTVLAVPQTTTQLLVVSSAERLLAAAALAAFPNNAVTDPTSEDRHDAHPATVRRALAFIDEHADQDITLADIAAAACVTVRAVQLAFRRHLNSTPTAYLRRVRLDHAHRDLLAGDPARKSVTSVAYRWGFSSSSRFTVYYRAAYGVPPSHTLYR